MKFYFIAFCNTLLITTASFFCATAQDDIYYDPAKDKGLQQYDNPAPSAPTDPDRYDSPTDKTDGYGNIDQNGAMRYDDAESSSYQQNGNTYVTNNYYDYDDDDSYLYTTRLRRYYTPNWGVNYYSYWFTPSYYYGWNNWNSSLVISFGSPWYQDPWWRWNHRHSNTVVIYDPWYDPYWDYNWGWSGCNYYNSWYNPYWGNSCSFSSWGYNGWGYQNGGFCGGYYNGYNYGYWNGYNNGYYDGYYNGYYNGWSNGYGYGNYYYGPRHRNTVPDATGNNPINNKPITHPVVDQTNPVRPTDINIHNTDIPKEGIQRPINNSNGVIKPNAGVISNSDKPMPPSNTGNVKPGVDLNNVNQNKNNTNNWNDKTQSVPKPGNNVQQPSLNNGNNNTDYNNGGRYNRPDVNQPKQEPAKPSVPNNNWNNIDNNRNNQLVRPDIRTEPRNDYYNNQPAPTPKQREWNNPGRNMQQPNNNYQQPRQEMKNFEPQRNNYQTPQREQRSISPGNSQGGGMRKKF